MIRFDEKVANCIQLVLSVK